MPHKETKDEQPDQPAPKTQPRPAASATQVSPGATRAGTLMAFFGFIMGMLIGRRQRSH